MQKYFPPKHREKQFHCIHCGVFAAQIWSDLLYRTNGGFSSVKEMDYCICVHCRKWSYWHEEKMIVPADAPVPPAHTDMPADCQSDYSEARSVFSISPRAAASLLRLALQKLMLVLGEKGKNINDDIGSLVAKGLPLQVQQALDFCRVVGNNAVHPGELNVNDTPEVAQNLFTMLNFIVEDRISRPKQIESLYTSLPEGARNAIKARDEIPFKI